MTVNGELEKVEEEIEDKGTVKKEAGPSHEEAGLKTDVLLSDTRTESVNC